MSDAMSKNEEAIFHRPKFDPNGLLRARRELLLNGKRYLPSHIMGTGKSLGLTERQVRVFWEQMQIDTLPAPAKRVVGRQTAETFRRALGLGD